MKKIKTLIVISILLAGACKDDEMEEVVYNPTPYSLNVPNGFPEPVIPAANPMTVEGVALGRMLYYDPILSTNGLKCASCHQRNASFSLPVFISSPGDSISVPPHVNLAWNPDYNWNGSEPILDHLCLADFGPDFFNTDMNQLVSDLNSHGTYPGMFQKAFGYSEFSSISHDKLKQDIVYAIIQFIRSMVSADSKFDRYVRHEIALSQSELSGYLIYMTEKGDCFHCHGGPLMTTNDYRNNGLDSLPAGQDLGRYIVTGKNSDKGKFSVPTLRNVELTAPYMHDGRFQTLEEVIEFYNTGVCASAQNIDPIMTKPGKEYGLQLTLQEKMDLIDFLKTFTDTAFISNPAYKSPFQ